MFLCEQTLMKLFMLIVYTLRFFLFVCFCVTECTVVMLPKRCHVEEGDNFISKHFPDCCQKNSMYMVLVHLT